MSDKPFEKKLEERFERLSDELRDREQIASQLRDQIDRRMDEQSASFQRLCKEEFRSSVEDHRKHIESLYTKFERIVWFALLLIGGVFAFLGYKSHVDLPNQLNAKLEDMKATRATEVNTAQEKFIDTLNHAKEQITNALRKATNELATSQHQIDSQKQHFNSDLTKLKEDTNRLQSQITNELSGSLTKVDSATRAAIETNILEFRKQLHQLEIEDDLTYLEGRSSTIRFKRVLDQYSSLKSDDKKRIVEILRKRSPTGNFQPQQLASIYQDIQAQRDLDEARYEIGLAYAVPAFFDDLRKELKSNSKEQLTNSLALLEKANSFLFLASDSWTLRTTRRKNLKDVSYELSELTKRESDIAVPALKLYLFAAPDIAVASTVTAQFLKREEIESFQSDLPDLLSAAPSDKEVLTAVLEKLANSSATSIKDETIRSVIQYLASCNGQKQITETHVTLLSNAPEAIRTNRSVLKILDSHEKRKVYVNVPAVRIIDRELPREFDGKWTDIKKDFDKQSGYKLTGLSFRETPLGLIIAAKISDAEMKEVKEVSFNTNYLNISLNDIVESSETIHIRSKSLRLALESETETDNLVLYLRDVTITENIK